MKIIGIVKESSYCDGGTYLAELTKSEIARLAGWPFYDDREKEIRVGSVIEVGEMFSHLRKIAGIPGQLKKAKDTIEAVASLLGVPGDVIDAAEAAKSTKP